MKYKIKYTTQRVKEYEETVEAKSRAEALARFELDHDDAEDNTLIYKIEEMEDTKEQIQVNAFNNVRVYDNGGKTVDQFTVLIKDGEEWAVFTMSLNCLNPAGINMYSHNVKKISDAITKDDKEIQSIPFDVREAIKLRIKV